MTGEEQAADILGSGDWFESWFRFRFRFRVGFRLGLRIGIRIRIRVWVRFFNRGSGLANKGISNSSGDTPHHQ